VTISVALKLIACVICIVVAYLGIGQLIVDSVWYMRRTRDKKYKH
jgi:hypothetical protein